MKVRKLLMRSDGDNMKIGLKNSIKLIGVSIIAYCAVFVCTLFINYNIDIVKIKDLIVSKDMKVFYDAQVMMGTLVTVVSGGCLLLTAVIMLCFYIKHYIDVHRKELGILKALGYSNWKIASGFWIFGINVFVGAFLGFCSSFAFMKRFYRIQNEDLILPEVPLNFNMELVLLLVILPTVFFGVLGIAYSYHKLKCPTLDLLKEKNKLSYKKRKVKESHTDMNFLKELKKSTVKSRPSLIFFIWFASFCFSSMMQMSASMDELSSTTMAVMIIGIGLILACTTLFLAITTVVNANTKTISMMRVFGYSLRQCCNAILNGYRLIAYIGFAIGTIYQYALLKISVSVIFKDIENVPEYSFDWFSFFIVLILFILIYEMIMYGYSARIKKISLKEVMLD